MSTTEESAVYDGKDAGLYWRDQIEHAQATAKPWEGRADKVVERYRDERSTSASMLSKFNILWSNVQVLTPSLYGRPAKPQVSRRHMDADPVGRLASGILERTLTYEIEQFPSFDTGMKASVQDRLLPGRGTVWIRANTAKINPQAVDEEYSPVDYVYWKDFLHSPARTWEEVWWVARRVYMTYAEGTERFGDKFALVKLDHSVEDETKKNSDGETYSRKAEVYEIWNKRTKRVCWIASGFHGLLDEQEDPLQLEGFFPSPPPLFATITNGSLIPVPDYCEYQDQAQEVDDLTGRIDELVDAVRVAGVYNQEFKELARLFQTKGNKLIGVTNWAAFAEKQGLKGAIDLMDLAPIAQALGLLYNAREAAKQTIYEICGISDILRGSTKAEETLGAQQLKANFGSLRLRASQVDVARFATDILRLKAQLICRLYPEGLLLQMSGITETEDGKDPQLVQQALGLLKNSTIRDFHITVESDSLAQLDDAQEKEEAAQMLTAVAGFMDKAVMAIQVAPELLPLASEILQFIVRQYRAGRAMESTIERSMQMLQQRVLQQAMNPPPNPEEMKIRAQQQSDQMRAMVDTQAAQQKAQFDKEVQTSKLESEAKLEIMKGEMQKQQAQLDAQVKLTELAAKDDLERWKASLDAEVKLAIAQISAASQARSDDKSTEREEVKKQPAKPDPEIPKIRETLDALIEEGKRPKNKRVIRDGNNRIIGVEVVEKVQ